MISLAQALSKSLFHHMKLHQSTYNWAMANNSSIEWTDATWNPVTGCTKISMGCKNCYAERLARRLKAMGSRRYRNEFSLTLQADQLELPLKWKKPRMIFVNSMSDLFHERVPDEFIKRVFEVMGRASWHVFQVLTKRADRLAELSPHLTWPENVWQGVTVEHADYLKRVDCLRSVRAAVRFISAEPLLGPLSGINLQGMDWVIVGGESGPGRRPIDPGWIREIRTECESAGTMFFFKQWGGRTPKSGGRELDGRTWDYMPIDRAPIAWRIALSGA